MRKRIKQQRNTRNTCSLILELEVLESRDNNDLKKKKISIS